MEQMVSELEQVDGNGSSGSTDLAEVVAELQGRVAALEEAAPENRIVFGLLSGNLDTTIAAFICALGARAYDIEVDIFATFWGIAAFRDRQKKVDKGMLDRMFGMMIPRGSEQLPLSKMQMAGIGPKMIRKIMSDRGNQSLEDLMREAAEMGVKLHVCSMTMDVMGIKEDEMIDYPDLDVVGVGTFIGLVDRAKHCWFF
jgi:peroxiredoxin family protein